MAALSRQLGCSRSGLQLWPSSAGVSKQLMAIRAITCCMQLAEEEAGCGSLL